MKWLSPLIILTLLIPTAAHADRGGRGDRGDRREARAEGGWPGAGDFKQSRGGRGDRGRQERRFRDRDQDFDRDRRRGLPPGQERRLRSGKPLPPGQAKKLDPRYDDDGRFNRGPSRRGGYGRGHILPSEFRGARMDDYARHRLRRPPAGYSYYRRGRDAYLVSDRTGMIFEVVPLGR